MHPSCVRRNDLTLAALAEVQPLSLKTMLEVSYYEETIGRTDFTTGLGAEDQGENLFQMLKDSDEKVPASMNVALVPPKLSATDIENLKLVQLLCSFISVNAMKLVYQKRGNKSFDLSNPEDAALSVTMIANALYQDITEYMGGFLDQSTIITSSYDQTVVSAEIHMEVLNFLFKSFSLPESALKELDGILTAVNGKLTAGLETSDSTLDHVIFVYFFDKVQGLDAKIAKVRLLYLKVDKDSWKSSIGKSSVQKVHMDMTLTDGIWMIDTEQTGSMKTKIQNLLTKLSGTNLEDLDKLTSPTVVTTDDIST